jgi:hypothetical protein
MVRGAPSPDTTPTSSGHPHRAAAVSWSTTASKPSRSVVEIRSAPAPPGTDGSIPANGIWERWTSTAANWAATVELDGVEVMGPTIPRIGSGN